MRFASLTSKLKFRSWSWPVISRAHCICREELRLPSVNLGTPRFDWRLCKLCDIRDWDRPGFSDLVSDIEKRQLGYRRLHRKAWEFAQTVYALQKMGLWSKRAVGLSVAGGRERLLYYGAIHLARFVAVDIYGKGEFAGVEADKEFLLHPEAFAPYAYPTERLKALYMNALDLKFEDNTFDFAVSMSSIEHFGGIEQAVRALGEMKRVVKPGGAILVTTECILNGNGYITYFLPQDIKTLIAASGLELIEDIDWSLSDKSLRHLCDDQEDDLDATPHLNLRHENSIWTSISLVFTKQASESHSALLETNPHELDVQLQRISTAIHRPCPPPRRKSNRCVTVECRLTNSVAQTERIITWQEKKQKLD